MEQLSAAFTVKLALDSTARLVLLTLELLSWEVTFSVEAMPAALVGMELKLELLLLALRMRE